MFVDELKFSAKAGNGGDGVVRFRHLKYKPKGGPSGGDGGDGGNVYMRAVRDISILSKYKANRKFDAQNGQSGGAESKKGENGDDIYIDLPVGSVLTNLKTEERYELLKEGQEILVLEGGEGGLGNDRFKSSTNITPKESTKGEKGEKAEFFVELMIVVDVGLIGLPSAGKSTLLNELTGAKAKVGSYDFTTLEPNLGSLNGIIIADIPGLIEGASKGKGLGHKFLRHIERTSLFLHCISLENEDVLDAYKTIRSEIGEYNEGLLNRPEKVLLTKKDLVEESVIEKNIEALKKEGIDAFPVSVLDEDSIKELGKVISKKV